MITQDQLGILIAKNSYGAKEEDVCTALNISMGEFNIDTPLRTAMYLAQILHETGGFNYFCELGKPAYFSKYEGRTDLGNTEKGDGYKFRGRGFIQITGRFNYAKAGKALGLDFIGSPDLAAELIPGARIAGWFWQTRNLNPPSERRDITRVTRIINGGLNGLNDRMKWYQKAKAVLVIT